MSFTPKPTFRCIHLFRLPPRHTSIRSIWTSPHHSLPFKPSPAPPRLPKEEQERFEELQRLSTGAFSTPRSPHQINQSPHSGAEEQTDKATTEEGNATPEMDARIGAEGTVEELHPNLRRGAAPEFEGDRNPKTGEVGGPKNEPLRWGESGDWSYNGRVTDF